jgi:hypothetical protein
MFTSTNKRKQRSLVALVVAAALTALVFAAASPAKTATSYLPSGHVDSVNGDAYYSGSDPVVSGWAIDGVYPNMTSPPIPVTATVTWYKKPAICALCTPAVVAQASFTQSAGQYRSDLPASNPYHGFAFTLAPPSGVSFTSINVCLSATGYYGSTSLGCYPVVYQPIV